MPRRFTLSVKLDHCSTRKSRTSLTDGGNQGRSVRASMMLGHIFILADIDTALHSSESEPGQGCANVRIGGGNTLWVVLGDFLYRQIKGNGEH